MDDTPTPAPVARSWSDRIREPRVIAALAGGVAVLLAVVLAALLLSRHGDPAATDSASGGTLQMEPGRTTASGAAANLRCFVGGQMVGEMPLADCQQRNGLSSQPLDVGLPAPPPSPEGAPPAAQPDASVQTADAGPPPAAPAALPAQDQDAGDEAAPADERGQCLRYAGGGWRAAPRGVGSLKACTHALFQGRCVAPGDALYGRYGALTLRAVSGRIEIAPDNRSFRPLVATDDACNIQD